jgi:hypothetical protein
MAICPATMKPCVDDICYGGGCLLAPGVPLLTRCGGCGQLVGIDGTDPGDACECEPECYEDDPLGGDANA